MVIWITGLSGSGKTTLCNAIWEQIKPGLPELVVLDGDTIRAVFGGGLGYREQDRVVQIRRIQSLANMLSGQGLTVLVAALYASPELLCWNRENIDDYFEVYLEASLDTLKSRDRKGLYAGAGSGATPNVVGVDIKWHPPETPDIKFNTDSPEAPSVLAQRVISAIPRLRETQRVP